MHKAASGYKFLESKINEGTARLTLLVGPPRSISTGTALALSQSPDIDAYIHEPFAYDYDGDKSTGRGLETIQRALDRVVSARGGRGCRPFHLIVKECSAHLSPRQFRSLLRICGDVIFMVRSPLLQLSSLARICKWIWDDCPRRLRFSMKRLRQDEIRRYARHGDIETYFVRGWRRLRNQIEFLERATAGNDLNPCRWFIFDTEILRVRPAVFLRGVASRLGIRYTQRMISGWRKDHLFNIENDEWSRMASRSSRLHKRNRQAPRWQDVPPAWRERLRKCFAIYASIFGNDRFARLFPRTGWRALCGARAGARQTSPGIPPDSMYALVLSGGASSRESTRAIREIRRAYPDYKSVFDCLDAVP